MKRNKLFYAAAVTVAVSIAVALPFAMDWLVIGNDIPSNISNSDWVGFLGGYLGALLGAVVSLLGIIITIRYTNEQNKLDRELQVRPYCSIRYVQDNKLVGTNKLLASLPIGCEPRENDGPPYTSILYFKNIGLGPAIDFEFKVDDIDDGRKHYLIFMQSNADTSNRSVRTLQPGEEAAVAIIIHFNFDPITEDAFILDTCEDSLCQFTIKPELLRKYKNFDIVIHTKYRDMFQNEYNQKVILTTQMQITGKFDEKKAQHVCDMYVKEIIAPIKGNGIAR